MKEIIGSTFSACVILTFAGCSGGGRYALTPPAGVGQGTSDRTVSVRASSESSGFRVLYSFQNGSDGAVPSTSLIADKHGDLFGTATNVGGVTSCNVHCGSIFELSPPASKSSHWTFTILYDFKGGKDGGLPEGNVMFGPDGSLYGTANVGGRYTKYGGGVVFQLKPSGTHWSERVLHYFGRRWHKSPRWPGRRRKRKSLRHDGGWRRVVLHRWMRSALRVVTFKQRGNGSLQL